MPSETQENVKQWQLPLLNASSLRALVSQQGATKTPLPCEKESSDNSATLAPTATQRDTEPLRLKGAAKLRVAATTVALATSPRRRRGGGSDDDESSSTPSNSPTSAASLRSQIAVSPLRAAFHEQKDQLFLKFGVKLEYVQSSYDLRIRDLKTLAFTAWGSTEPQPLPEQLGKTVHLDEVCRFVIPFIASSPVQCHAPIFLKYLSEYDRYQWLILDMYWYFFLEFFALAEAEERLDRHRLKLLNELRNEEPSGQRRNKRRAGSISGHDQSVGSGRSLPSAPQSAVGGGKREDESLNYRHPIWKRRLSRAADDKKKEKMHRAPPKPLDELRDDDDDFGDQEDYSAPLVPIALSELTEGSTPISSNPAGTATIAAGGKGAAVNPAIIAQERRKEQFLKKLKRRQLVQLPGHVMSDVQVSALKYPPSTEGTPVVRRSSRGHMAISSSNVRYDITDLAKALSTDADDDDRVSIATASRSAKGVSDNDVDTDARSSVSKMSMASFPGSEYSAPISDDESLVEALCPSPVRAKRRNFSCLKRSSANSSASSRSPRHRPPPERPPRLVRGEKNFGQALAILLESEELEPTSAELAALLQEVNCRSPEGLDKERSVIEQACELINREQHRIFGRMANHYITSLRELPEKVRSLVGPHLPELIARIVVQLLYITVPYGRDILNRRVRKFIKKKMTYWMAGIENANIEDWSEGVAVPMDAEHRTELHQFQDKRWKLPLEQLLEGSSNPHTRNTTRRGSAVSLQSSVARDDIDGNVFSIRSGGLDSVGGGSLTPQPPGSTRRAGGRSVGGLHNSSGQPTTPTRSLRGAATTADGSNPTITPPQSTATATPSHTSIGIDVPPHPPPEPQLAQFAWNPGTAAYHRAFDEIADDFDRIRRGETTIMSSKKTKQPDDSSGKKKHDKSGGGGSRGGVGGVGDQKILESHRHAPINRRPELWHEQGRSARALVNAESKSRKGHFDLGNLSPFMKRYMKDVGIEFPVKNSKTSWMIRWT